jgi:hypothetical protein
MAATVAVMSDYFQIKSSPLFQIKTFRGWNPADCLGLLL